MVNGAVSLISLSDLLLLVCRNAAYLIFLSYLFIYWLCWVFVAAHRLSLVVACGGQTLAVVCRLLIAVASRAAEHSSRHVVTLKLCCPKERGIFPDRKSNPCPSYWQTNS